MSRTLLLILISLTCGLTNSVGAQTGRSEVTDALRQLLTKPVPIPPAALENEAKTRWRVLDEDNRPSDDAPLDELLDYWTAMVLQNSPNPPTDKVRQRLFEACRADPDRLRALVSLMPQDSNSVTKIKELYDAAQSDQRFDQHWATNVKEWLLFNSNYFVDELVSLAQSVKDSKYGGLEKDKALVALAKVDWQTAEPLVRSLAESGQPRIAALALTLFYSHAIAENDGAATERYRNSLKAIASDRNQPAWARDKAIEKLSLTDWTGRDDWYLSLFQDETLNDPTDGQQLFSPPLTLFMTDPEKWIPVMARMTGSKDLATRSSAARCLITFQNQRARKDALIPLLPWLTNPGWANDRFGHRRHLIQSMGHVDLPESVPGLIWVLENDDSSTRSYAAYSLGRYCDPRAIPALKRALSREKDDDDIERVVHGLLACQGLSEQEQLEAIEAYALKTLTPEGLAEVSDYGRYGQPPLPVPLSIGKYLVNESVAAEALERSVLQRAEAVKNNNQPLAEALLEIAHGWQGRPVDLDLIHRIGNGSANANAIKEALDRRSKWRESFELELRDLVAANGPASGIAAVLLGDSSIAHSILSSDDQLAQIALLATSRLTHTGLPVQLVSPLLRSNNDLLALAAERYLLAEDSKDAREALWRHHPNEAFIAGWREYIEFLGESYEMMDRIEKNLRAELFKEDGPTEIYALVNNSVLYTRILRVYKDRAVYTEQEDASRYRERTVSPAELAAWKDFIAQYGVEDRGPAFDYCHHNCATSEYLKLTKERGRRVFNRSGLGSDWRLIWQNLELLGRGDNVRLRYNLEKEIKGLEILFADKDLKVQDVWTQGSEVRISVERQQTQGEQNERNKLYEQEEEEETEYVRVERQQRIHAIEKARFSWRTLVNGKTNRTTAQPDVYLTFDEKRFPILLESSRSRRGVQMLSADAIIVGLNFEGLWKQVANAKAVRLGTEDGYRSPVVTPGGKWVIATRTDKHWSEPKYIIRYNLRTGREFRVGLEPAGEFEPIAFIPAHGKVLLRRAKEGYHPTNTSVGPDRPEYYLLDADTGKTQLVSGVFAPLLEDGNRFLQATGNPDEFWATIFDEVKNQTQVGRYNLKDFSFKSMLTVPHISFGSMSTWVDAKNGKLYVVYKDQLLRLPFHTSTR